ncbi:PAS domain-containing sensor histidine kinase [Aliikangiella sp. IMCC44653]
MKGEQTAHFKEQISEAPSGFETQWMASVVEDSSDAILTIGLDGNITSWNSGAVKIFGYSKDEAIGSPINIIYPQHSKTELNKLIFQLEKGASLDHFETQRITKDSGLMDVSVSISAIKDGNDNVVGIAEIIRDISNQKSATGYARSLIEASLDPLVTISVNGKITDVNEATVQVTGRQRSELIGSDFSNYFTEPDKAREGYQQVFSEGIVKDYPLTIRSKDGHLTDVLYNATVYKDGHGNVLGVFASARDVTEQKRASQYARSLIEASLDPLVTISADGIITDVNDATIQITGCTREELIGSDFSDYFTDSDQARRGYLEVFSKGQVTDYALTIRQKDGKETDVLYNASVYRDEQGAVRGVFAAARDITGQKQASQYARSLIEASLDPLVTISAEGKITDVNEATMQITGCTREELIGSDFSNYFTEPEKARAGYLRVFSTGRVTDYALTIRHIHGKLTDVLYNAAVYKDTHGNVLGVFAAARDVSEQKQASQYARSLIEASLDPLVTISPEGKITDVNQATIEITGRKKEELIGSDFSVYFTEPEEARRGYQEVFSKGKVTDYALTIRHSSGKVTDVLYNAAVYKDIRGNVLGVFAAARDVTEQKEASQYARSLIEASLDPLVTISPEGKITDVNQATVEITGRTQEDLIGSDFSDYFTEPEEAREGYQQVFEEGFVRDYPLAIRHVSGKIAHVLYNATVYKNPEGEVIGVFAAARDITERKKVEEQLHSTSAYARSLIETSLDPLVTISPEGKITDVNHATENITGVTREWLIGTDFSNYFTEPRRARQGYRKVFKEGRVTDYPLVIKGAKGRLIDVVYNASVYSDAEGKVRGVFAAARDVSSQKQASEYARSLIEASLDPLVTISSEGKITDVNQATIKVTGIDKETLIGSDFSDYFTEPDKARLGYEIAFRKGEVKDYPLTIKNRSGALFDVLYNASVFKDREGNVLGVFAAARDNSRAKLAQKKLEQTNKDLEAFTYSVSHDLRAPLRQIDGFASHLQKSHSSSLDEEGARLLSIISGSSKKLGRLIDSLLEFSKLGRVAITPQYIDMNLMAKNVYEETLKQESEERDIQFILHKLPDQSVDIDLMQQVWRNLLSNAIKFTRKKEDATIEVSCEQGERENIYSVRDNGAGFDSKFSGKLFEVFSRLHDQDEFAGTGIGLAICRRIIHQHQGKIWAESEVDKGTVIYFSLLSNR